MHVFKELLEILWSLTMQYAMSPRYWKEKTYITHDKEFSTLIHSLKMRRKHLMGNKFQLRNNHNNLRYLIHYPNINIRQTRWLGFLCHFEFEFMYIKGKENRVINVLNKRMHVESIIIFKLYFTKKSYRFPCWRWTL